MFYKIAAVCLLAALASASSVDAARGQQQQKKNVRAAAPAAAKDKAAAAVKKATPSATRRQVRQHHRIKEGVKSGELTKEEAKGLAEAQKEIRRMKQDARVDGTVTKEERLEIQRNLNEESQKIYDEKHDAEVREKTVPFPVKK